MFDAYQSFSRRVGADDVLIAGVIGGNGPPLLLLHGYPQSHLIWHRVAAELATRYTVVATDLRGYGGSDKPVGAPDHTNYSKRVMAADQVAIMQSLGFDSFYVCAHDRGARVAHRMAIDSPTAVRALMLLDIAPTLVMYEQTSMEFARLYWWWFFLIQATPFPENMILAAPETFLRKKIGWGHAGLAPFTEVTWRAYLDGITDPATVHGMCEDYRAAASIDLEHDRADRDAGRLVACSTRVLWGQFGVIERCFSPLHDWQRVATEVSGRALPCGHYIPEEVPLQLLEEICAFFAPA